MEQPDHLAVDAAHEDRARIIYLDQHIWVSFLRGLKGRDQVAVETLEMLRSAVADGSVVVPLSVSHYLETWHRKDFKSRHQLATLMKEVSNYATLSPTQTLQPVEVERAVLQLIHPGWPAGIAPPRAVGHGVCHAFGSETGRFRFVESLATGERPEGKGAPQPESMANLTLSGEAWEWMNLAGPQGFIENDGIEITPEHRLGSDYQARQLQVQDLLKTDPAMRKKIRDVMVLDELLAILPMMNEVCTRLRFDIRPLLVESPIQGRSFVENIPTCHVHSSLRLVKHRNPGHNWEQHDRTDIIGLSVAIPYCDAVVTEKQWAHLSKVAQLDQTFRTVILSSVADLRRYLVEQVI